MNRPRESVSWSLSYNMASNMIRRQSLVSSVFTYLGFAIGAVNILFLFPRYFTPEQFGLTRILLDVAMLLSTICTLGSIPIVLKFFPFYQRNTTIGRNDLPWLTLGLVTAGCLLTVLILPWMKPWIIRKFGSKSPLFVDYFDLLYPLTITLAYFSVLEAYAWSLHKTILSNVLKEFAFRLLTTVLIFLFIAGVLKYNQFITLYAWIFLLPVIIFLAMMYRERLLVPLDKVRNLTGRIKYKIMSFGGFLFAGAVLNIIAKTNDTIILASQSKGGLKDAAVFTIATYLVTVMEVPQRSLVSITTPLIASAWRSKNILLINRLYQKTSLNLMIAGLGIFGLVLLNIREIGSLLGPAYTSLASIVLISGLAKLIDLSTGLNTQILLLSKYWKLDFLTNMIFVALSIPLNYWLTRRFNTLGPAYGNLIALIIFNGLRYGMIWKLFGLQPFTWNNLKALLLAVFIFAPLWFLGNLFSPLAGIAVKSILFTVVFSFLILRWNVSADLNDLFRLAVKRFSKFNN